MKKKLLRICIVGVFSAVYVLLNMLSIKFGNYLQISISALPIILVAIYLGPISGMCVGLIGEFLSQLLEYGLSVATLWWTLPAAVRGLAVGLIFISFKRSKKFLPISINVTISSLLVTILNTLLLIMESKILGYYSISLRQRHRIWYLHQWHTYRKRGSATYQILSQVDFCKFVQRYSKRTWVHN